jgi:hypothetical protein
MIEVSPPLWYGLALGLSVATWIAGRLLYAVVCFVWSLGVEHYLRYVAYPPVFALSDMALTGQQLLYTALYMTANGLCLGLKCSGGTELSSRAGTLATINLIPLLVGTRLSTVAELLALPLRTIAIAHRWIGFVFVLEAILHTILILGRGDVTWDALTICGVVVRCFLIAKGGDTDD